MDVFNESHDHGTLPISQRKSVMSLIFRKGSEEDKATIDLLVSLMLTIDF